MSYLINDLNPQNPTLMLGDKNIVISLMTLEREVFFIEKYGSLTNALEAADSDHTKIIDIVWELVLNRSEIGSVHDFKELICSANGNDNIGLKMGECLNESLRKSRPSIKNRKRHSEINKITNVANDTESEPCYAVYYDSIAKRYGYSIQEFYGLTLSQVYIMLTTIGNESHKEIEIQAAINGRELKPRITYDDISEEQEADQDKQAVDAVARLRKEYEERKLKNGE